MNCPNKDRNLEGCTCTYPGCSKKGMCCDCINFHRKRGEVPGCLFPPKAEKTFDRSADKFRESA